jgi:hypothetical protein
MEVDFKVPILSFGLSNRAYGSLREEDIQQPNSQGCQKLEEARKDPCPPLEVLPNLYFGFVALRTVTKRGVKAPSL